MVRFASLAITSSNDLFPDLGSPTAKYSRRRLPTVPQSPVSARPLPQIPPPSPDTLLTCRNCEASITSQDRVLPPESVPATHRTRKFSGFSGPASLFTKAQNVTFGRPRVQLMATGAHTCQEITCNSCSLFLGWKIVRAHEKTERWKEGYCLLELEALHHPAPHRSRSF